MHYLHEYDNTPLQYHSLSPEYYVSKARWIIDLAIPYKNEAHI